MVLAIRFRTSFPPEFCQMRDNFFLANCFHWWHVRCWIFTFGKYMFNWHVNTVSRLLTVYRDVFAGCVYFYTSSLERWTRFSFDLYFSPDLADFLFLLLITIFWILNKKADILVLEDGVPSARSLVLWILTDKTDIFWKLACMGLVCDYFVFFSGCVWTLSFVFFSGIEAKKIEKIKTCLTHLVQTWTSRKNKWFWSWESKDCFVHLSTSLCQSFLRVFPRFN